MNPDPHDRHAACLARALGITDRLKSAKGRTEIASEISGALLPQISKTQYSHSLLSSSKVSTVRVEKPNGEKELEIWESQGIGTITLGGLRGIHKLDDLVKELMAAYVSPPSTPGNGKRAECRSFAFFVGAFSALARREDVHHDLVQVCEAGRDEAMELAAAAALYAHPEMLDDMQRGIKAVEEVENRHSILSRHVVALRQAFRKIVAEGNAKPFKGELRKEAISILKAQRFKPYGESNSARWREVFQAAELSYLEQERGKREKSRKGDW